MQRSRETHILVRYLWSGLTHFLNRSAFQCYLNTQPVFCRQEKESDDIQLIAARAVNTSTAAYELARDAIKQQQNIRYCKHSTFVYFEMFLSIQTLFSMSCKYSFSCEEKFKSKGNCSLS